MNTATSYLIEAIDTRVAQRSLLRHPFYQSWTRGELSLQALRDYAKQYYHHVAAFPTYLSAVHCQTEDAVTRRHLLANLIDEEAGHPNHPELWLQFAAGLDLGRENVLAADLWPETANLIRTFRSVCRERGTAVGLAALYAYESQIPEVAESKINGLEKFYRCSRASALEYFQVHIEADREHAAVERELLAAHLSEPDSAAVLQSVDEVLEALWEMLSGVCRRHESLPVC